MVKVNFKAVLNFPFVWDAMNFCYRLRNHLSFIKRIYHLKCKLLHKLSHYLLLNITILIISIKKTLQKVQGKCLHFLFICFPLGWDPLRGILDLNDHHIYHFVGNEQRCKFK